MGKATNPRKGKTKVKGAAALATKTGREIEELSEKSRRKAANDSFAEGTVTAFAQAHGHYVEGTVVDLSGELGGKPMSMVPVLLNRGGTAVDRWIARDERGIFGEPQQNAIRYCRTLWARAAGMSAIDPCADRVDVSDKPDGWSQQEALDQLDRFKNRIPRPYWDVFENVCRFDEEAGSAGSSLASNSRSAIDAAKTTVAFCASIIAMDVRL